MRCLCVATAALLLSACTSSSDDTASVEPGDGAVGTSEPGTTLPTGPRGTDEGHVTLMALAPQAQLGAQNLLAGVFTEADRGWLNLAQCLTRPSTYCVQEYPVDPGTWVPISTYDDQIGDAILTRDLGPTLQLGPFTAEATWDADRNLGYYLTDLGMPSSIPETLGLTLGGGDWPAYSGESDIEMASPMVVYEPDPRSGHTFHSANPVPLRWEPGGVGDVYLAVVTPNDSRLFHLEDTGAYDLDFADFDLWDYSPVTLALGRWTFGEVEIEGNRVTLQVQSDQYIHGEFRDVEGREELRPAANCEEAEVMDVVRPGTYYGDISDLGSDNNPGAFGCTGYSASGPDGLLKVGLEPNQYVEFVYQLPQDDASVYLAEDCYRAGATCLVGSDGTGTDAEVLSYYNESDERQTLYLVLDSVKFPGLPAVTDLFTLDVSFTDLLTDVLYPECVDAMDAPYLETGAYVGDVAGHANVLDPIGIPTCLVSAPGGEGIAPVQLAPYERVTVEVSMPGSDPILYWLYQCNLVESCAGYADTQHDSFESIVWENDTPFTENRYLVVDSAGLSGEYYLSVVVE